MSKKLNGLPALPTTSAATMTDVKTDATMTVTTTVMITTAAMTATATKMLAISGVMTTQRAQGVDKAIAASLITRSTPPILEPSTPMMLTSAS